MLNCHPLQIIDGALRVSICFSTFQERINFEFEKMFETGVDEMSWDDTVGCIFIFNCFVGVLFGTCDHRSINIHTDYAKQHPTLKRIQSIASHHITSQTRNPHPQWGHQ